MVAAPPPLLAPLKPCYVSFQAAPDTYGSEVVPVSGSGFAPGERLTITVDGIVRVTAIAAAADGTLPVQSLTAPTQLAGERAFTVAAIAAADGSPRASATTRVS